MSLKYSLNIYYATLIISFLLLSCDNAEKNNVVKVDFSKSIYNDKISNKRNKVPLKIAISAMISPKETFVYYKQLVNYISSKLNISVVLKQRKTYKEINDLFKTNELDLAYICSGAFIEGEHDSGFELLVAPIVKKEHFYYAYIIVHKDSQIKKFKDLYQKRFAFTDPLSNTGRLYPLFLISKLNKMQNNFFSKTLYTNGHDKSIYAITKKIVDGASVDSLIFDYISEYKPELVKEVRIIKKSPPYGIPPFVIRSNINLNKKEKIRNILLEMHKDDKGKLILNKIMIEKFVKVKNTLYDSIKKMKENVKFKIDD